MRGSFERQLAFGAVHGWGFGSGGLDGMDAADQFGGPGFDTNSDRGGGGGALSKGYDDQFDMRAAAKDAIDAGFATEVGYDPGKGGSAAGKAASAFGAANTRTKARDARATPQDRREALSNANNEAIADLDAQGLTAANLKARDIDGYAPSSAADRRGVTSRDMQSRDYSQAARDAARDAYSNAASNGLLGAVAYGVNPALGVVANTTIDVNQAADYSQAYGMEKDALGAIGNSLKGQAIGAAGGLLGAGVGGALGGAIAGAPGAMLGSIAGRSYGRDALGSAYGNSIGQPGQNNQAPSAGGLLDAVTAKSAPPEATPATTTGYASKFGNYSSHLNNFSSRALNAWA